MPSWNVYWRTFSKDRIFLFLFGLNILTFLSALTIRRPSLETSAISFHLALSFFCVDSIFSLISLRREPLLSYMFLTAAILLNGTLYFFFHYLIGLQVS